jgi:hypothetical protein
MLTSVTSNSPTVVQTAVPTVHPAGPMTSRAVPTTTGGGFILELRDPAGNVVAVVPQAIRVNGGAAVDLRV